MYNREYYEDQRQAFYDRYDELTSEDTALKKAVLKALDEQDERLEKSFSDNEYLKDFTEIAYSMQIETVDDFENYLSKCLGGRVIDGVRELRNKSNAFYSASNALAQIERPLALRPVSDEEGDMLWEEKTSYVATWNRVDGFSNN